MRKTGQTVLLKGNFIEESPGLSSLSSIISVFISYITSALYSDFIISLTLVSPGLLLSVIICY